MTNSENRIEQICEILSQSIPSPETELSYSSDYTFLIAVILSAQTTDVQVNKVTSQLFLKYKTIDDFLALGEEGLTQEIKSIGLFKSKAKNIILMSKQLKEKFNSQVPRNREDLESLAGVGRKTANVVLNTLFGLTTIAVDTHVLRLSKILELSSGNSPLKVEEDLLKVIPARFQRQISNLLVLHGRYVCKARKPNCKQCVLAHLCNHAKV